DCSDTLSATNTHGHQRVAPLYTVQLVQGLDGDDGAGGSNGVTKTNTTTVRVHTLVVHTQLFGNGTSLRGRRLVSFNNVHLINRQARLVQCRLCCRHGTNAHV